MKLLALVIVLNLISALITYAFIFLVHQGTSLLWKEAKIMDKLVTSILIELPQEAEKVTGR